MSRTYVVRRDATGLSSDRGAIAVFFALMVPVVLGLSALAVDISSWYVEAARAQKAADAAALAGVTWMPQDFTSATTAAQTAGGQNGYTTSQVTTYRVDKAGNSLQPSQIRVSVTRTINNFFGVVLGKRTQVITREATADFQAPAIMGNPCNTFGNEPTPGPLTVSPTGSVLPATGGFATCTSTPNFWATVQGPNTNKLQGDRYMTRRCATESGFTPQDCSGSVNDEYKPEGYFFVVRVEPGGVGKEISVQLYDPAHVYTSVRCDSLPPSGITNGMNDYAPDAVTRYGRTANNFCTGDYDPGNGGSANTQLDTTFALREQIDTLRPLEAAPITGCIKTYRGNGGAPTAAQLTRGDPAYRNGLAKVFHQWNELCKFTPNRRGDYYLQVRTNIAAGSYGSAIAGTDNYIYAGTPAQYLGAPTITSTRGNNAFAMRARFTDGITPGTSVAVAGWERMPVFVNGVDPLLNLVRVTPNAAGSKMTFSYFDFGDTDPFDTPGTVQVLPPTGSSISLSNCTFEGPSGTSGPLSNCTANIRTATHNGKLQSITVPIPASYTCDTTSASAPGNCWFRIQMRFPSGTQATDITTWDAVVLGDPVRLIK